MTVKVKSVLTKTLSPKDVDITKKKGVVIQYLDDDSGLCLIDFGFIQWYVHENDFHLEY